MSQSQTSYPGFFSRAGLYQTALVFVLVLVGTVAARVESAWCADTPATRFFAAEAKYLELKNSPRLQKYRDRWLTCIQMFESVYRYNPEDPYAPAGMYWAGVLYHELYKLSGRSLDLTEAMDTLERVVRRYPKSRYNRRAQNRLSEIRPEAPPPQPDKIPHKMPRFVKNKKRILAAIEKKKADVLAELYLRSEQQAKERAEEGPEPALFDDADAPPGDAYEMKEPSTLLDEPKSHTTVSGLRYWSNPNYTRVVVDADRETKFRHNLLRADPRGDKPKRLFVDLEDSRLHNDIQRRIPINDDLLLDTRAGQYKPDVVRVVIDIKSFDRYKIFSLQNPFRIVIDVWGTGSPKKAADDSKKETGPPIIISGNDIKPDKDSLATQLALGVRRVVIDPGHGGRDYGAPGYHKGVYEKKVVLQIAKKLAQKLRDKLGLEAIMTRDKDVFPSLEERTAIANTKNADLFISIHTNAHPDKRIHGIETYYLNLATDEDAIAVAARENATSKKSISDLQSILNDLMQNAKISESRRLAQKVQKSLAGKLKKHYSKIRDRGVKKAPFYVLLGAQMPAVLVEVSYISNSRECRRLTQKEYQNRISDAIVDGIRNYIKSTNPTALIGAPG